MYFENIDISLENEEYYNPLKAKAKELKKEKENLEEYFRQLMFIKYILEYIIIDYSNEDRQNFIFDFETKKNNGYSYNFVEGLNILLNDFPSHNKNFSKIEIIKYIRRLDKEIENTDLRINRIISQLNRYQGTI